MDKLASPLSFNCPKHPSQKIQGIDPRVSAERQTYCFVCIIESQDSNALYQALQTLPNFLDSSAVAFADIKATINPNIKVPQAYLSLFSNKTDALNKMKHHINKQKQNLEESMEDLKKFLIEIINQKKIELTQMLDQQLLTFTANYECFEKELRTAYPRQDDIAKLFPTKKDLENMFKQVSSVSECDLLIKKIKHDLKEGKQIFSRNDQSKKLYLDYLMEDLKNQNILKPIFEINLQTIKDELKKAIIQQHKKSITLKDPIFTRVLTITPEDLSLVKEWMPEKHKNAFNPKLIYKGLRDGMTPQAFHSTCDGKGATITFIKCKFEGSSEIVVIGGFLDKDWSQHSAYLNSNEAFIFSLTSRIKCPYNGNGRAACGSGGCGPVFGGGHDIMVNSSLGESYVNPYSYNNAAAIVQSPKYEGFGKINFFMCDIEVYTTGL